MDELDQRIQRELLAMTPEWNARAAGLREAVQTMYEEKRKKAVIISWIGTGIGLVFMLMGVGTLLLGAITGQATTAVAGAMFFLFGDGWMTGSKLIYATWKSRIQLERDIKELHYDVLELHKKIDGMSGMSTGA